MGMLYMIIYVCIECELFECTLFDYSILEDNEDALNSDEIVEVCM